MVHNTIHLLDRVILIMSVVKCFITIHSDMTYMESEFQEYFRLLSASRKGALS